MRFSRRRNSVGLLSLAGFGLNDRSMAQSTLTDKETQSLAKNYAAAALPAAAFSELNELLHLQASMMKTVPDRHPVALAKASHDHSSMRVWVVH